MLRVVLCWIGTRGGLGCCLGVLLLLGGCKAGTSTVSGKVTYKGQPLPRGTVIFVADNGRQESANLAPDGTYFLPQAPTGSVKVAVQIPTPLLEEPPPTRGKADSKPQTADADPRAAKPPPGYVLPIPIPKKYYDTSTSGLVYSIGSGSQTIDIDLKP